MPIRQRFAERRSLLCPPSPAERHHTPTAPAACKLIALPWTPASVCANLTGFRPSQQKSAQVRFRCAVYSQLWAAVGSVLKLEVRGQHFKGAFKWQIHRKQQLLQVPREG